MAKVYTRVPEYLYIWNYPTKLEAGMLASTFVGRWGVGTCCRIAMEVITMELLGEAT